MREEKRERETGDGENREREKGKGERERGKGNSKTVKEKQNKKKRKKERKNFMYTRKYALKKFGGRVGQCGWDFVQKPQNFKFFWVTRTGSAFYKIL